MHQRGAENRGQVAERHLVVVTLVGDAHEMLEHVHNGVIVGVRQAVEQLQHATFLRSLVLQLYKYRTSVMTTQRTSVMEIKQLSVKTTGSCHPSFAAPPFPLCPSYIYTDNTSLRLLQA